MGFQLLYLDLIKKIALPKGQGLGNKRFEWDWTLIIMPWQFIKHHQWPIDTSRALSRLTMMGRECNMSNSSYTPDCTPDLLKSVRKIVEMVL